MTSFMGNTLNNVTKTAIPPRRFSEAEEGGQQQRRTKYHCPGLSIAGGVQISNDLHGPTGVLYNNFVVIPKTVLVQRIGR